MSDPNSEKQDSRSKLLLDEDTKSRRLRGLLAEEGYNVATTSDLGIDGSPDETVCETATADDRAVVTRNCGDFLAIHNSGQEHAGIVLWRADSGLDYEGVVKAIKNADDNGQIGSGKVTELSYWSYTVSTES